MKNSSRMKKHVNTAMDMFPVKVALYAESMKSISKGTYEEADEYERFLREEQKAAGLIPRLLNGKTAERLQRLPGRQEYRPLRSEADRAGSARFQGQPQ